MYTETEMSVRQKKINIAGQKRRKKRGIAFRMLVLMIVFIAIIFSAIFVSFNFSIEEYVKRETTEQLTKAISGISNISIPLTIGNVFFDGIMGSRRIDLTKEQIQQVVAADPNNFYELVYSGIVQYLRTADFDAEVTTVLYSNNSQRLYPDDRYFFVQNLSEMDALIENINLNTLKTPDVAYRTSTSHGNYYLSLIDLEEEYGLTGLSVALYVNTAKYDSFIQNINVTLLIILIIATVFSIIYVAFISRNISKPVRELSQFADEIGRGNFKQTEYNFQDREFIDLNSRMNETAEKLKKNDEDQKTFFQNVSHELRTPLMSIKGYAEGIKYGVFPDGQQQEEASEIIISETDRLNNLVSDLLYISKLDSLKKVENKISVDLVELVKDCVEKLSGLLINSHKKININAPDDNIYIECDESSLIRAILNVIANCVQYAKSEVNISIYIEDNNINNVILSVKDDGNGIDEADLPNIFKRFYKGKAGKHGIGLAITKAIVEQHSGEIYARNTDTGAEFIFKF